MNKRRRTSSVASRGTEDDPDEVQPEPTKRRKKLDPVSFSQVKISTRIHLHNNYVKQVLVEFHVYFHLLLAFFTFPCFCKIQS